MAKQERIEVGDLVWVARGHSCLLDRCGGIPFVVERFNRPTGGGWFCMWCSTPSAGQNEVAAVGHPLGAERNIPLSWLQKFHNPPIRESIEGERKVVA